MVVIIDFVNLTKKRLPIAIPDLESEANASHIKNERKCRALSTKVRYLMRSPSKFDFCILGGENEDYRVARNILQRSSINIKFTNNTNRLWIGTDNAYRHYPVPLSTCCSHW